VKRGLGVLGEVCWYQVFKGAGRSSVVERPEGLVLRGKKGPETDWHNLAFTLNSGADGKGLHIYLHEDLHVNLIFMASLRLYPASQPQVEQNVL
jgi:hypothetical protein